MKLTVQDISQHKNNAISVYEIKINDKLFSSFTFNKNEDEYEFLRLVCKCIKEKIQEDNPLYFQMLAVRNFAETLRDIK